MICFGGMIDCFSIGSPASHHSSRGTEFMVDVKGFVYGLVTLNPSPIPAEPVFLLHFTLVLLLMAYFPFSKLLHAGGIFFSPTRHQCDNPREKRHINPWSPNLSS